MPSKCFASWASPNWTRPPRRRDKNRSCSDQPQNPPPYLLGVTGHNVKHALGLAPKPLRLDFAANPNHYRVNGKAGRSKPHKRAQGIDLSPRLVLSLECQVVQAPESERASRGRLD